MRATKVQVSFTGLCLFVPKYPTDADITVLLPNAARQGERSIDDQPLRYHTPVLRFHPRHVGAGEGFPPHTRVAVPLWRRHIEFVGAAAQASVPDGVASIAAVAPGHGVDRKHLSPVGGLIVGSAAPEIAAVVDLRGCTWQRSDRIARAWDITPPLAGASRPPARRLCWRVTWEIDTPDTLHTLVIRDLDSDADIHLRLLGDGTEKIALEVHNSLPAHLFPAPGHSHASPGTHATDQDFRWFYQLLEKRGDIERKLQKGPDKKECLPIPRGPIVRPHALQPIAHFSASSQTCVVAQVPPGSGGDDGDVDGGGNGGGNGGGMTMHGGSAG